MRFFPRKSTWNEKFTVCFRNRNPWNLMITYSLRIAETNRKLHISVEFPLRKPPGNGDSLGLRTAETCGNFRFLHWNPAETNSFHKFTQGFQNVYAAWKLVFSSSEIDTDNTIINYVISYLYHNYDQRYCRILHKSFSLVTELQQVIF